MELNWIKVMSSTELFKVELAKSVLQSHQIESMIVNKQDSAYVVLGFSELHVPEANVEAAIQVLKEQDLI